MEDQLHASYGLVFEVRDRVGDHEPAVTQDGDDVRHRLDLAQHVGGEEHGAAAVPDLPDQLEELALDEGVQPRGRLVEDEQVGVVHECLHDADLLAVAVRERADADVQVEIESLGQRTRRQSTARHRAGWPGSAGTAPPVRSG